MSEHEQERVPCTTCGDPARTPKTDKCGRCWEVEHRLRGYMRAGGLNAAKFVADALREALDKGWLQ